MVELEKERVKREGNTARDVLKSYVSIVYLEVNFSHFP